MCDPVSATIAAAAVIGAGTTVYTSGESAKAQRAAQQQSEKQAADTAQRSEQQFNKANQKSPDIAAMFSRNQEAMKSGTGATFLTGPQGVAPSNLVLGKTTLLGG
jgi:hypothetical protein